MKKHPSVTKTNTILLIFKFSSLQYLHIALQQWDPHLFEAYCEGKNIEIQYIKAKDPLCVTEATREESWISFPHEYMYIL